MRRVFPLKPAEANVLVAYQNGIFEPHSGNDIADKSQVQATRPFSDESNRFKALFSSKQSQDLSGDQYPVFKGGSCSPRSPLSVGTCREFESDDHCESTVQPSHASFSAISSSLSLSQSPNECACCKKTYNFIVDEENRSTINLKLDESFTPFSSNTSLRQVQAVSVSTNIPTGLCPPCSNDPISDSLRKQTSIVHGKSRGRFAFPRWHSLLRYFTACLLAGKSVKIVRNQNHFASSKPVSSECSSSGGYEPSSPEESYSGGPELQRAAPQYETERLPFKFRSFQNATLGTIIQSKGDAFCSFERGSSFHNDAGSDLMSHADSQLLDKGMKEMIGDSFLSHEGDFCSQFKDSRGEQDIYLHQFVSMKHEVIKLWKDKRQLVLELLSEVKARMTERSAAESALKRMQREMEDRIKSLESEHDCVRGHLENEIERKEKEWVRKLEKLQTQDRKLRERIIRLAGENVDLQKDISSYRSREAQLQSQTRDCEMTLQIWIERCRKSEEEVLRLKQNVEDADIRFKEKEREIENVTQQAKNLEVQNGDLFREFSRLKRATEEHDITFEELSKILVDLVICPPEFKEQVLAEAHRDLRRLALKGVALLNEIGCLRSELSLIKSTRTDDTKSNGVAAIKSEEHSSYANPASFTSVSCRESEPSNEEISELEKLLCLANVQITELERKVNTKDRELHLLQLDLQKSNWELSELHRELDCTKMQRDGFCKQAECKNEECIKLCVEVAKLKKMVEKLDEEVMLKEGEISILREAYVSESDF